MGRSNGGDDSSLEEEAFVGLTVYLLKRDYLNEQVKRYNGLPFGLHIPKKRRGSNRLPFGLQALHNIPKKRRGSGAKLHLGDQHGTASVQTLPNLENETNGREPHVESENQRSVEIQNGDGSVRTTPKKREPSFKELGLVPPPDMPADLRARITREGGADVRLVIMKRLFRSDLSAHLDRLSIPCSQADRGFLTEEEEERLERKESVKVKLVEPSQCVAADDEDDKLEYRKMRLRKWNINTTTYALTSSWKAVFRSNEEILKEKCIVQIWSFRVKGKLRLAIIKVRDPQKSK